MTEANYDAWRRNQATSYWLNLIVPEEDQMSTDMVDAENLLNAPLSQRLENLRTGWNKNFPRVPSWAVEDAVLLEQRIRLLEQEQQNIAEDVLKSLCGFLNSKFKSVIGKIVEQISPKIEKYGLVLFDDGGFIDVGRVVLPLAILETESSDGVAHRPMDDFKEDWKDYALSLEKRIRKLENVGAEISRTWWDINLTPDEHGTIMEAAIRRVDTLLSLSGLGAET